MVSINFTSGEVGRGNTVTSFHVKMPVSINFTSGEVGSKSHDPWENNPEVSINFTSGEVGRASV